jgi:hypothetical protein
MSTRNERIARNEAMFREGNERMHAWPETQAAPPAEKLLFLCECADPKCRERVALTTLEYEAVRADPMHFAITPGHERLEAERVVGRYDGYVVIEKHEDVRGIAERTDPRSG